MKKSIPQHIAIIMDGNGRWAKEQHLPRIKGHEKGVEIVEKVIEGCIEIGVTYLTLYAFSTENWNRPKEEIKVLMNYLSKYLDDKRDMMMNNEICFNAIGRIYQLREDVQEKIHRNKELTRDNKKLFLTLALSYSGRTDIIDAIKQIVDETKKNIINVEDINEDLVKRYLSTSGMPDPDLLIRTSGEMRMSNFLLWQISYTELYFTPKYWPDFSKGDLLKAIDSYKQRERRFGKIVYNR